MSPESDAATRELVKYVRRTYGLDARSVAPIEGRTHAEASAYRVDGPDGSYFLKLTPGRGGAPSPLGRHLVEVGISQVLVPPRTRDGHLSTRLGDRHASLYPFVDGENAFRTPLSEDQWIALGRVVRAIHDLKLPSWVSAGMRRENYSDEFRRKTRRQLAAVPPEHPGDSVAREFIGFLTSKRAKIMLLVEHAERLAPALRSKALSAVPCHGDLHAGNVLSDGVRPPIIVDWDDPVFAPKERDLMFVGAGIGGAWNREEESAAFYRGYGAVAVDDEALAYYRCERIVEDVAVFCEGLLLGGDDGRAGREELFRKFVSAFDPNDVVEIAEKTIAGLATMS
jgi:spectinomycin phosphotransferase